MAKQLPVTYGLRGKVGDETKLGQLALGSECVLVIRCTVARKAQHFEEGLEVCDATLKPITAALIEERALATHGMDAVRKLLNAAAEEQGQLPL